MHALSPRARPGHRRAAIGTFGGDTAQGQRRVTLTLIASREEAQQLSAAIHELLNRLGVDVWIPAAPEKGAAEAQDLNPSIPILARVTIEMPAIGPASILIQDARSGEVRLRRDVASVGSRQVLVETTSHIVYTSIETLSREADDERLARQKIPLSLTGGPRDGAAPVSQPMANGPSPESDPPPGSAWRIDAAPFYAIHRGMVAQAGLNPGAGIAVVVGQLRPPGKLQPSLWLSLEYRVPFDTAPQVGAPRSRVISLRLAPMVNVLGNRKVALQAGPDIAVDIQSIDAPVGGPPPVMGMPPSTGLYPLLGLTALLRIRIAANAQLFVATALDYALARPIVATAFSPVPPPPGAPQPPGAGPPAVEFSSWRFLAVLGIAVTLSGPSSF